MAPKRPTGPKVKQWNDASNARTLRRRGAVRLLNGLAEELGAKPVKLKAPSIAVEALVRVLDPRCQTDGFPARLRSAVTKYLDNGGKFSAPLLPATAAAAATVEGTMCDTDGDAPPPLTRHRLLEDGFRLESKAFTLTYNSRSFS